MKIGIFDSGVGGLSIMQFLYLNIPNVEYVYIADIAFVPYGEKSQELLYDRCLKITQYLEKEGCDMVIIACNTAIVASYQSLKDKFSIPILEIVTPNIYNGVALTKNNVLGVLATPFTVNSNYYPETIKKLGFNNMTTLQVPCNELTIMIENNVPTSSKEFNDILKSKLNQIQDADTIIIGCTHYIHIIDKIKELNPSKNISTPLEPFLKIVNKYLEEFSPTSDSVKPLTILTTKASSSFNQFVNSLFQNQKVESKVIDI